MKTFNYESKCVRYKNCFFDTRKYKNNKISLAIYGYVEDDQNLSHISNVTVDVEEKLEKNQVVIDSNANTNLISFLLDLDIIKSISRKVMVGGIKLPVVELDLEKLDEYSYNKEILNYAS